MLWNFLFIKICRVYLFQVCLNVIIIKILTMKKIKFICLSLIFILFSCNSNDENNSNEAAQSLATRIYLNTVVGTAGSIDLNSNASPSLGFTLVFPIKVTYSSGARVTINSIEGLKEAIYNESSTMYIRNIVFPFSVALSSNNDELIVSDESDFQSLLFSSKIFVYKKLFVLFVYFNFINHFHLLSVGNCSTFGYQQ